MIAGVLMGLVLGFGNYFVVKNLVLRLVKPGTGKLVLSLLFVLKMLSLLGLVAICSTVFKVNVVAFVIGYSCTLAVPVLAALRSLPAPYSSVEEG